MRPPLARFARCGVLAVLALSPLALSPSWCFGGTVSFTTQNRFAMASADVSLGAANDFDEDQKSSDQTGAFAETVDVSAHAEDEFFTVTGHATARQDSLLSPSLIRFAGFLENHADTAGALENPFAFTANAQVGMQAQFVLPQAQQVLISGSTEGNVEPRVNFSGALELTRVEDGAFFDLRGFGPMELDAGTYDLDFRFAISPASTVSPESIFFNFDVNVDFGGTGAVIPLPAAAVPGAAMLLGLGAWRPLRRRFFGRHSAADRLRFPRRFDAL